MVWNYKPKKNTITIFIIVVLFISCIAQSLIKQKFISEASSSFVADRYGNILFHGKPLSAYDDRAKGTLAWFLNPLIGWEVPAALCVLFIGIGVLFVFHKSRVLALHGNAMNYTRKIKDLEETIRAKNSVLSGLENDRDNKATMIGNVRKELSQYKEGYDSMSREITKVKEQCQATLAAKDQDHERVLDVIKTEFSEVILLTKKDCRSQIEQIKKQYENQGRPIMDENTI